jgi:hypothetical protein
MIQIGNRYFFRFPGTFSFNKYKIFVEIRALKEESDDSKCPKEGQTIKDIDLKKSYKCYSG